MKIGEKIKKLRTEKLMTQSELVGNEITRNMLSRIENGSANPSLETVRYIAARLNVSVGFLLAEGNDEQIYFKHNEIIAIKQAFLSKDYRICRDICLHADSAEDDEIRMLLAESDLAIAVEAFDGGNLREACQYLDECLEVCDTTRYRTEPLVAIAGMYFRYMRRLSATLSSNVIDEGTVNIYPSLTDAFCRYAYCLDRLDEEERRWEADDEQALADTPFALHYRALLAMREQKYEESYSYLHEILLSEMSVPEPMLYFIFCDLEVCCREIENFKGAYEYSIDKIELLQKLLR